MLSLQLNEHDGHRFLETAPLLIEQCGKVIHSDIGEMVKFYDPSKPNLFEDVEDISIGDFHSYRDFRVASGFVAVENYGDDIGVYVRGNIKKQGQDKSCAEKNAEAALRKSKYSKAVGGVVLATSDVNLIHAVTAVATPTLHPCPDLCQPILRDSPVIPIDMPIITIANDGSRFQVFTLDEMLRMYVNEEYDLLRTKNIGGRLNFFEAMVSYKKILKQTRHWKNIPSPAEIVVSSLLETADN